MKMMMRIVVVLSLIVALLLPALPVAADEGGSSPGFAPDRILVKFKPGIMTANAQGVHSRLGGEVTEIIPNLGVQVIQVPASQVLEKVRAYNSDPAVEYAEPDYIVKLLDDPDDPGYDNQWGLEKVQAPEAWDVTTCVQDIKIAILDTGIDQDHEDLAAKIVANRNFTDGSTVDDLHGHGTHVAGIAAAITDNGIGVAGLACGASLMNGRVLDETGHGYDSWVINGIIWAADNGANVINMSLGSDAPSATLEAAVNYAWDRDVVIVAAAGNDGNDTPQYPAYYSNCISVAAADSNDYLADFSTYGSWVDVAAPGVSIYSTLPNHPNHYPEENYGPLSGTSMAAPFVSGLAALVWSTPYGTSNENVRNRIENTADLIAGTGSYWQHGRINARQAVEPGSFIIETRPAAGISRDSAILNGEIMDMGEYTSLSASFVWGTFKTGPFPNSTPARQIGVEGAFSYTLANLDPGTTCYYRAKVEGEDKTVFGTIQSFTTQGTFGLDSGNGNYNQFGDALQAMRFENTAGTGTLTQLELLVDDTTPAGKVVMGVYADDNGKPGTLLLDASEVNVKNGWVARGNLNLEVTEGEYYWLAFNLDSQNVIRDQSDQAANSHYRVNGYPYGALPSAFPSGALINNGQFVMRATVDISSPPDPPSVTTGAASNISHSSAALHGYLLDIGSASAADVSFVWGTALGGPYPEETVPRTLTVPGAFTADLTGLTDDTKYYYRAKAVGSGTVFGGEQSFSSTPLNCILTMDYNGSGTINPNTGEYSYHYNTEVDISAAPAPNWQFSGWTGDVARKGAISTTVTMDKHKAVTANFKEIPAFYGKIVFSSGRDNGNDEIYSMTSSGIIRLTDNTEVDLEPVWSPDGTRIAYVSQGGLGINVMDADGSNQTRLTDITFNWHPTWSPDGEKIAWAVCRYIGDTFGIYVMNADGSDSVALSQDPSYSDTQPAWSPDGTRIAFISDRDTDQSNSSGIIRNVYVMNADGSNQIGLTDSLFNQDPAWSPDSTRIAFCADPYQNNQYQIFVMNADGSDQVQLTDDACVNDQPTWSPDGAQIAFRSDRGGNWGIYLMNADGSNIVKLTENLSWEGSPNWTGTAFEFPPLVTSSAATGITDTSAVLNGELADKGSASSVSCSFVWGTTPGGPYTNETNPALTMPETGPFSFSLTGLSPDTEYFYRARAAGDGASYGEEVSFKTDKESPPVLWEKNYGSDDYDWGNSVLSTSDGGYLITATKYRDLAGYSDVWVIKTDSSGNSQWDQTFGTLWGDYGVSAVQTADNGYVIGYYSYPGDWDVREFSLVKIDSEGNKQWEKAVDATADDAGQAFIQTDDGGYAIVGSYGDLFLDNNGELLLIKTNSSGDILWYKTFDGPEPGDFGYSVIEAADGGYVIAGASGGDEWLIKTDNSGNLQWNKTFSDMGAGLAIIPANEGGYIIAGNNWLQKTDLNGNEQWRKNLNQSDVHYSISIRSTFDGGYIITGNNWLLKTDVNGNEQWNKTLAGRKERVGNSLIQTADGGYVVTGTVLPAGATRSDVYLAKIEGDIEAAANISVGLQGGSRPDGGWVVPLTVKFFTPGADVLNETPLYTFDLATTKSGSVAVASCAGIAPGDYDITVASPHTLMNVRRDVSVTLPEVQVFMETLLEGDANNDGLIDIRDFGLLSGSYLQASINPMADFDRNGIVNIQDFALLSANYSKLSPIEVR